MKKTRGRISYYSKPRRIQPTTRERKRKQPNFKFQTTTTEEIVKTKAPIGLRDFGGV